MGSRGERSHKELVKRLLRWPGMRERPESGDPFGDTTVHPTLRMNGARFMSFHRDGRRLVAALHLPPSLADVPEAEPAVAGGAEEGRAEAWIELEEKGSFERAFQLAQQLYEVRAGKPPPPEPGAE